MSKINVPTPVMTGIMKRVPPKALDRAVNILLRHMGRRHPRLFRRLSDMDAAKVLIEPTDLPYNFLLRTGNAGPAISIAGRNCGRITASIKGKLSAFLDMLEGRTDGDALFFSRDIDITGDTSAIVALRNILDGEDIRIIEEILSLSGPLAKPVDLILRLTECAAKRIRVQLTELHTTLHGAASAAANTAERCQLRDEIQALKTRLDKLEVRHRIAERNCL